MIRNIYNDGEVWDIIPSPQIIDMTYFYTLPESYEFPPPSYTETLTDAKLVFLDFSKQSDGKI